MNKIVEADILVEGNGLIAVTLAYFLSKNNKNKEIVLLEHGNPPLKHQLFIPGVIMPLFELEKKLLNYVLEKSNDVLVDFHAVTDYFDASRHPLILMYRNETLSQQRSHLKKFENSSTKHSMISKSDIKEYYPLINCNLNASLLEIKDSWISSQIPNLITFFRNSAEENGVKIIKSSQEIKLDLDHKTLFSPTTEYKSSEYTCLTTVDLVQLFSNKMVQTIMITTPIIEQFPKISLHDYYSKSLMWLEEAGYFHIYQTLNNDVDTDRQTAIAKLKEIFNHLFPLIGNLPILDIFMDKTVDQKHLMETVGKIRNTQFYYFMFPTQAELTLSLVISELFSKVKNIEEFYSQNGSILEKILESAKPDS